MRRHREWRWLTSDEAVWQAVHQHAFGGPPPDDIDDDLFDDDDDNDEPKESDEQSSRWRKLTRSLLEAMKRKWPQTWRDVGTQVVHEEWLAWAIGQGHVRIVLPLLRGRSPVELARLPPGLMVAAGRAASLELLVLLDPYIGVNVAEDSRAMTALHQACLHGHAEAAHWLLEHGADVDQANDGGKTALMYAAEIGADRIVTDLLAHGADPRLTTTGEDYRQVTALHLAAGSGSVKTVRALLAAGADIRATTRQGYTALNFAASKGDEPMLELLLELLIAATDPSQREPAMSSCLTTAAEKGHIGLVLSLLKGGAPPGRTALRMALANNDLEIAAALVDHGAEVNERLLDTYHSGPAAAFLVARGAEHSLDYLLRSAVHQGDVEAARALLNPPPPPFDMDSLLFYAVYNQGNVEMARLLLENGAKWNGCVGRGIQPRMLEMLLSFAPNE